MRQFTPLQVNVPPGTPATAPVSQQWHLYPGVVHSFRIDIPRGHRRLTGIRIVYQGRPIIPFDLAAWLVGDGGSFTVPYEDEIMSAGLHAEAYNPDAWAHTFYLWADVDPYATEPDRALQLGRLAATSSAARIAAVAGLSSSGAGAA